MYLQHQTITLFTLRNRTVPTELQENQTTLKTTLLGVYTGVIATPKSIGHGYVQNFYSHHNKALLLSF